MKLTTLVLTAVLCILLGSIILASTKPKSATADSPAPPSGNTGAPPGEGTCATCHTGSQGQGGMVMGLIDFPASYVPGRTDTLVIGISNPDEVRWGFEVTVLKNSDNTMAGTLTPVATLVPQTGVASSGGRTYAGHRSNGAIYQFDPNDGTFWGIPNGAAWEVEWTAPPAGAGPVTFYAAGVAANGDGQDGNTDTTYTAIYTLPEQASSPVTQTTWGKIKKQYK